MRSDCQEVPAPFTKADADKTETLEARLTMARVAVGCQVYWPAPYEVCGLIKDKYNQMGGPNSFLLFPKTNELTNPGNTGKRTEFLGGNIYWSAATGAKPVAHDFLTKWGQYGYEGGFMKYPTTDEIRLGGDNDGRRQEFQGAYLYYSIPTGTHNVQGAILDRYKAIGAQNSVLGYPTSDEMVTPDGKGRYNKFEYGSLYWSASSGAHAVYGEILPKWGAAGYEGGTYGYPTGDTVGTADGGASQVFQRGTITVSPPDLGSPPFRRGVDKEIGEGELTFFHQTGEMLYCLDFRHIFARHFPQLPGNTLNYVNWVDFQTCLSYTLATTERGWIPNKSKAYGRTRYHEVSDVRSYAIIRDLDTTDVYPETGQPAAPLSIVSAYTTGDGGRDWGGCRQGLTS